VFNVIEKKIPRPTFRSDVVVKTVYAVLDDSNGFPKFLFYEKGQWVYHSAKHFEPYDSN